MQRIKVDWAALHSAFQSSMPEVRCFLSLEDGQVLKMLPGDPKLAVVRTQPTRYLPIETVPSRIQYQWVEDFIRTIKDEELLLRLQAAANGKGAFRRFKDILQTEPEERRRWFEMRDEKMRDRIGDWIREQGLEPINQAPWQDCQGQDYQGQDYQGEVYPGEDADDDRPLEPARAGPGPANRPDDLQALRQVVCGWRGCVEADIPDALIDSLIDAITDHFRVIFQRYAPASPEESARKAS